MFKNLKTLVIMQLKDKIDFGFTRNKKSFWFRIIFMILGLVSLTALIYLAMFGSVFLNVFSLIGTFPISVVVVIFTVMQLLSILSCTNGLTKTLYFSLDNQLLLTFPVKSNLVFISKLIVFYIYEILKNIFFMLPLFFAFGLVNGLPIYFYFWVVFIMIIISMLPVVVGALLSIPAMFVRQFLKNFRAIQIFLVMVIMGALAYGVVNLISLIPANINIIESWGTTFWQIQDFLNAFVNIFLPFTYLTELIVGVRINLVSVLFTSQTFLILAGLISCIVVVLLLTYLIARPLFFKMASMPFEYKKKDNIRPKKNWKNKPFLSNLKKEFLISVRTPEVIYSNMAVYIMLPIAIFLLNTILAAMDTRMLGDYMSLAFNILMVLLVLLANNAQIASAYSKEGASGYMPKTTPTKQASTLLSKLVINAVLSTVSLIITICLISSITGLAVTASVLLFFTLLFINLGHMLWSAELDIMNPQYNLYSTYGQAVDNPNEKRSSTLAFLLSFLVFAVSIFLFIENINVAWIKIFFIGLAIFASRLYLYFTRIKVYYKEK
ncbi:MAG: hypothetical protein PHR96_01610 [Clostridia bacterium]|nr:hypothetical protein [Clostridia bacterium]